MKFFSKVMGFFSKNAKYIASLGPVIQQGLGMASDGKIEARELVELAGSVGKAIGNEKVARGARLLSRELKNVYKEYPELRDKLSVKL